LYSNFTPANLYFPFSTKENQFMPASKNAKERFSNKSKPSLPTKFNLTILTITTPVKILPPKKFSSAVFYLSLRSCQVAKNITKTVKAKKLKN